MAGHFEAVVLAVSAAALARGLAEGMCALSVVLNALY